MLLVATVDSRNPCTAFRASEVIALAASLMALSSFSFASCRPLCPQVGHRLKAKQQPVETLQQGVVQLPRNAGALAHSRVERHLETVMQLPDPDPVASQSSPSPPAAQSAPNQAVW